MKGLRARKGMKMKSLKRGGGAVELWSCGARRFG